MGIPARVRVPKKTIPFFWIQKRGVVFWNANNVSDWKKVYSI